MTSYVTTLLTKDEKASELQSLESLQQIYLIMYLCTGLDGLAVDNIVSHNINTTHSWSEHGSPRTRASFGKSWRWHLCGCHFNATIFCCKHSWKHVIPPPKVPANPDDSGSLNRTVYTESPKKLFKNCQRNLTKSLNYQRGLQIPQIQIWMTIHGTHLKNCEPRRSYCVLDSFYLSRQRNMTTGVCACIWHQTLECWWRRLNHCWFYGVVGCMHCPVGGPIVILTVKEPWGYAWSLILTPNMQCSGTPLLKLSDPRDECTLTSNWHQCKGNQSVATPLLLWNTSLGWKP